MNNARDYHEYRHNGGGGGGGRLAHHISFASTVTYLFYCIF